MIRVGFYELVYNQALGLAVYLRHIVIGSLALNVQLRQFIESANDKIASTTCRADRNIQHGLHDERSACQGKRAQSNKQQPV